MSTESDDHAELTERRAAACQAIVDSDASKQLIVAGPGTGKTYAFKQALQGRGEKELALTFIRNLVADLEEALSDVADVFTFHGLCNHLVRKQSVEGLEQNWEYYPPLPELLVEDLHFLGRAEIDHFELGRLFHLLDDSGGLISTALDLGTYYNAAGHNDVVLRELRHLEAHGGQIPTYPLIVVDEYQDFSLLEAKVIGLLASKSDILIAGDDDQALYEFKGASPQYIRELATGGEYELLALPYCSRCTEVIVAAVNDVLSEASNAGHLKDRLEKDFHCFLPDKSEDSETHPKIVHAACTVDRKGVRYPGRYVAGQISEIPPEDIQLSREGGFPTALVIGPNPFLGNVYEELVKRYPQTELKGGGTSELDALRGYELLSKDATSRLGWRIVIHSEPFEGSDEAIAEALRSDSELADALPDDYRERHLAIAGLIGRLLADEELGGGDVVTLEEALGRGIDALLADLGKGDAKEEPELDPAEPTILCTSLQGSKGLSACHVFIVGFIDGHFPRESYAITDNEICSFVVGLSRTRKACHLVSVRNAFGDWLNPSSFLDWIRPHVVDVRVNKDHLEDAGY